MQGCFSLLGRHRLKLKSLKNKTLLFIILFITHSPFIHAALTKDSSFLVVIDPGHGGSDHGAVYKSGNKEITEKDLTLQVANEIARELRSKQIRVILTRRRDKDLSLSERTAIANKLEANMFLSLHFNSFQKSTKNNSPGGIETYILNTSTDKSSKKLAKIENTVLHGSQMNVQNSNVALILKDLTLDANLPESKKLACAIQNRLVKQTSTTSLKKIRDRGVKQALFQVLLGADMPSVLIEAGFLSNHYDRSLLLSKKGKIKVAKAISNAISDFKSSRVLTNCKVNRH